MKEELAAQLRAAGHEVVDFGAHALNSDDDYPDFVIPLPRAVTAGKMEREVEDDQMNVICMGGLTVGPAAAWDLVETFLAGEFSGATQHLRRLSKVVSLETKPLCGQPGGRNTFHQPEE